MRHSARFTGLLIALYLGMASAVSAAAEAPKRVVSMNLCTDQLAILLADPDQLQSVSYHAHDPHASVLSQQAARFPVNHGLAEELLRMKPDLVIAGKYSAATTKQLLRRLNIPVAEFDPARSFEDIRTNIKRMGQLLHQQARAERLMNDMDDRLHAIQQSVGQVSPHRPVIASYESNHYSTGGNTLESHIVHHAGYRHLGAEKGVIGSRKLPLEYILKENPDYLLSWTQTVSRSTRATAHLRHPALKHWFGEERLFTLANKYWVCGAPFTLEAIEQLISHIEGSAQ